DRSRRNTADSLFAGRQRRQLLIETIVFLSIVRDEALVMFFALPVIDGGELDRIGLSRQEIAFHDPVGAAIELRPRAIGTVFSLEITDVLWLHLEPPCDDVHGLRV